MCGPHLDSHVAPQISSGHASCRNPHVPHGPGLPLVRRQHSMFGEACAAFCRGGWRSARMRCCLHLLLEWWHRSLQATLEDRNAESRSQPMQGRRYIPSPYLSGSAASEWLTRQYSREADWIDWYNMGRGSQLRVRCLLGACLLFSSSPIPFFE